MSVAESIERSARRRTRGAGYVSPLLLADGPLKRRRQLKSGGQATVDTQAESAAASDAGHLHVDVQRANAGIAPESRRRTGTDTQDLGAAAGDLGHTAADAQTEGVEVATPIRQRRRSIGTQKESAPAKSSTRGRTANGTQAADAEVEEDDVELGHAGAATHGTGAQPGIIAPLPAELTPFEATIAELREQHRQRQDLHRAEKSLTLQIKAKCRRLIGGDKAEAEIVYRAMLGKGDHALAVYAIAANAPFLQARSLINSSRVQVEKRLTVLAKQLPAGVVKWAEDIRGLGMGSLAAVIGECGDIGTYSNPAKLWKRMGLAVMPDGGRQRRVEGAAALEHGYSPSRRSIAWNISATVMKIQSGNETKGTEAGPYRVLYDQRKAYERPRVDSDGHAHNRALRYVAKRILRNLWRAWRADARANDTEHGGDRVEIGGDCGTDDTQTRNVLAAGTGDHKAIASQECSVSGVRTQTPATELCPTSKEAAPRGRRRREEASAEPLSA